MIELRNLKKRFVLNGSVKVVAHNINDDPRVLAMPTPARRWVFLAATGRGNPRFWA